MMKGYKWSLLTMVCSWIEVLSVLGMIWVGASYVDVLANRPNCHDWNAIKLMVDYHNQIDKM